MSNFFSSPWFLEASADTLFAGDGARPRTVQVDGQRFDALVLPDGSVVSNPMSDFLEPRSPGDPPLGEVVQVRSLPRVATARIEVTRPPAQHLGVVPSPYIDWRGFSSWETYVAQASRRDWRAFKNTARKRRKLTRDIGPIDLTLDLPDHDLVEQALMHKARQLRLTGGLDRFASRRTRQLVHRLVHEGHLTLSVLSACGRPLAYALAHWGGDRVSSWITSYDPGAADFSPGTQLYEAMMQESFSRGHTEFDFLIGAEPYKYHYATHERLVGPVGQASRRQRLAGTIRTAIEADQRPRRLRQAARKLALRAAQLRLAHQSAAPIDDDAFRAHIEANTPGWPWAGSTAPTD